MDGVSVWSMALTNAFNDLSIRVASYLPNLIAALVIFLVGILVASTLSQIVKIVVRKSNVDPLLENIGVSQLIKDAGFNLNLSQLSSWLVKWFIILIFLIAVADTLGLPQISQFIDKVALYIPNVIGAAIILMIGVAVANILSELVKRAASKTPLVSASLVAAITKWSVLVFVFMAVLAQLQIASRMIETLFTGIVAAGAVAFGIAFGLGGKDEAKKVIDRISKELSKKNQS